MSAWRWRYLTPIVAVESYLLVTLLIFAAGPVVYYVEDPLLFWGYIVAYQVSLFAGYLYGAAVPAFKPERIGSAVGQRTALYWFLLTSAFIAFLIGHKNIAMSDSLVPIDLLENVFLGLTDNQEVYSQKISRIGDYTGDKFLNVIYIFFAYSRIVIVSYMVYEWEYLRSTKRLLLMLVAVLPVLSGVSVGTNKPLFDFSFIFGMSLAIHYVGNLFRRGRLDLSSRSGFLIVASVAFVGAIGYFGFAMQSRGGDADYIVGTSPLGHIRLDSDYLPASDLTFFESTWVWLSGYLVQGYYGFSQALLADFSWTYGVGNSQFLSRQVEWITGVGLMDGTFPHKISSVWDEDAQWHSWYSHLASDFHFPGIALFMAAFGYYFARVWKSYCDSDDRVAPYLLPLFGIAFIFAPANNQVFGFIETFSAFVLLSSIWLCNRKFF